MDILEPIERAVACGMDIVCSPQAYRMVRDKVTELENQRDEQSINAGLGPSMRRRICVEWHSKQRDPPLLAFDDHKAFRDHLDSLGA